MVSFCLFYCSCSPLFLLPYSFPHPATCVSWNVHGLGHPVKHQKVLSHLSKLNSHVAFLEETHCNDIESLKLKCQWDKQVIFSSAANHKGGVAILFHKSLNTQILSTECDANGRWVLVDAIIFQKQVTFFNIYCPVKSDPEFWHSIKVKFSSIINPNVIVAGDFNDLLDPFVDRKSKCKFKPDNSHKAFQSAISSRPFFDVWKTCNTDICEFTFSSNVHYTLSHIDYVLVSKSLLPTIQS